MRAWDPHRRLSRAWVLCSYCDNHTFVMLMCVLARCRCDAVFELQVARGSGGPGRSANPENGARTRQA